MTETSEMLSSSFPSVTESSTTLLVSSLQFSSLLTVSVVFEQQGWGGIVFGVSNRFVVVLEAATSMVFE